MSPRFRMMALTSLFLLTSAGEALADVSDTLRARIIQEKIFTPQTNLNVQMLDKQAILRVGNYQPNTEEVMRIDSVLAAKKVIDAYPQISCVVVRYAWSPDKYTDIFVTSKQIISFGAGTIEKSELLAGLTCIKLSSGDSPQFVFSRYFVEGESALAKGDNGKAELLFNTAFQQAPTYKTAALESKVATDYLELSRNYSAREDYDNAARVLKKIIDKREEAGQSAADLETAKLYLALADNYIAARRVSEMEETLGKFINGARGTPLASTVTYAQALEKLASGLQSGNPREQELLREALKVREALPGAEDVGLVMSLEKLADSLRQSKTAEAVDLYKRAITALDKAMVSRDHSKRISYEVYSTSVNRMHQKLAALGAGPNAKRESSSSAHW
ncbi:MAG TPA: tetratricopeptide repeat protein [Candidatus Melainabacteria bacterium]|nr:tetratricopeptide repeat protein [Candidatus Melainabacteria bacterium]